MLLYSFLNCKLEFLELGEKIVKLEFLELREKMTLLQNFHFPRNFVLRYWLKASLYISPIGI